MRRPGHNHLPAPFPRSSKLLFWLWAFGFESQSMQKGSESCCMIRADLGSSFHDFSHHYCSKVFWDEHRQDNRACFMTCSASLLLEHSISHYLNQNSTRFKDCSPEPPHLFTFFYTLIDFTIGKLFLCSARHLAMTCVKIFLRT
jgi:hypothetical protein